ncbi:hypothetical protein Ahy_A07g034948 [Arachis hypogaea]|uniref:Protein FAR1-RELATED SEQUENCE n=1 Tax=Arachis hypogaea TaxID=3818 RepID=A0A445CDD6_ARAHY|nr:hypothetical protein Ahy_A07g034948 [Arachis hypogaea]
MVVTSCESMEVVIKAIFPKATNQLCAWHMEKNVTKFETTWEASMYEYEIGHNFWCNETYDHRRMWANAYLDNNYMLGFIQLLDANE